MTTQPTVTDAEADRLFYETVSIATMSWAEEETALKFFKLGFAQSRQPTHKDAERGEVANIPPMHLPDGTSNPEWLTFKHCTLNPAINATHPAPANNKKPDAAASKEKME